MASIKQAADDLKNLGNRFKSILEVQEILEYLGDLENAKIEFKNLRDKAHSEYQDANKQLENIHNRIQVAGKSAESAEAKADQIISDANRRADGIIAEANNSAVALKNEGEKSHNLINKQISELKSQASKIDGDIKAKQKELENLQSAIQEAKSKVASL